MHPASDLVGRVPVWEQLQMVWMDTEVEPLVDGIARVCAASPYGLAELEAIYWNEVRPAVWINLLGRRRPSGRGSSAAG